MLRLGVCCLLLLTLAPVAQGHPIPRRRHDRTILVSLETDPKTGQPVALVHYRLEVDEFTAVREDLLAASVADQIDLTTLHTSSDFYDAYTRCYAPILAANLIGKVDGRPLEFAIGDKPKHTLVDETGVPLGHLRCDFTFKAPLPAAGEHRFAFREGNYELEEGQIQLSLAAKSPVELHSKTEPDAALQQRPAAALAPGEEDKLRKASATYSITYSISTAANAAPAVPPAPGEQATEPAPPSSALELLNLLLDSRTGNGVLLLLAAFFGAAHALTPGHGKTLVAAYLVGEQGTIGHALVLGLITTLTHTGAVIVAAILLPYFFPDLGMTVLGLIGGLAVAGMGLWLLLRRLGGQADHVHLFGRGHHHHHHGPTDHYHDEHGHAHPLSGSQASLGWLGLIVLGVSGGMVPCTDAILMLAFAVTAHRLSLALPLLLAFSAGLAAVLIAIGIGVVYVKGFAGSHWGDSRLFRALPLISAALVTLLGFWLCYASVNPS
jgi:ABC-type nickel/cobalt efflux system permease component RcnA